MCGIAGYIGKNPPTINHVKSTSKILEQEVQTNMVFIIIHLKIKTILYIVDFHNWLGYKIKPAFFLQRYSFIFNGEYIMFEIRKIKDLDKFQNLGIQRYYTFVSMGRKALEN